MLTPTWQFNRSSKLPSYYLHNFCIAFLLLPCFFLFPGCDQVSTSTKVLSVSQGSITNPPTGMKAAYRNIETSDIKLVMNDEVLGHTDIPLGEKFYIINNGIKGLTQKEGMVSIGCSLLITDEKGATIMNVADLFSGNDVFKKEEVETLRCSVSTGLPMESEAHYLVKAKFWDKYGDGFIENVVKIRVIDMP
jgi:hypothetical protein